MTLRRFEIVAVTGTGTEDDPFRPNVAESHVVLGVFPNGNRALIKRLVPDGTAQTPGTLADVSATGTDVNATALGAGAKAAIKTFLTNQGVDVSQFDADSVDDRRKLLLFVMRRVLGWKASAADFAAAMSLYDAAG